MEYPSCAEKSSSWHLTGEGTKEKVRWIRKTPPTFPSVRHVDGVLKWLGGEGGVWHVSLSVFLNFYSLLNF